MYLKCLPVLWMLFSFADIGWGQAGNVKPLVKTIEVIADSTCSMSLENVLDEWTDVAWMYSDTSRNYLNDKDYTGCFWTQLTLVNPDTSFQVRYLYFPMRWQSLECYIEQKDSTYQMVPVGIQHDQKMLPLNISPKDTIIVMISYPGRDHCYIPHLHVNEFSKDAYRILSSRGNIKFLILGVMIFPLLFFMFQYITQREKIGLYYLIFLIGSTGHLLTILEGSPYFRNSPMVFSSMHLIKQLFVLSTFLVFLGLIKYIHHILDIAAWSRRLWKIGNVIIWIFLIIVLIPIVFQVLFRMEYYDSYLQYFRLWAFLMFIYIFVISAIAIRRKIRFSQILLIAFSPLIITGMYYSLTFLILGSYSWQNTEAIVLIAGFLLTILLFGVVLGVRNNTVRNQKLILEQETKRLRELDRFKSRFYTNITHEFRTPLTVIKGMAGQVTGAKKIKELIIRNCDRLLSLVNQLMDLSRLENNVIDINWIQGDIIPYLHFLTESCQSVAIDKNISLSFYSIEQSLQMDYDEDMVQKILSNLILNAIKFTPQYGRVQVILAKITLHNEEFLEMVVEDTGKGIPKDHIPKIFNPFYQVDNVQSENTHIHSEEGSGIGLAIVHELVELLGGKVSVESELNKGSKFTVTLPIHHDAPKIQKSNTEMPNIAPSNSELVVGELKDAEISETVEKPLVLIIEDNLDVTAYIISCLQNRYQLQSARNGKSGVEKALEVIPDVILCDVMMPEMDGFEVCRILKSDRHTSHIPIILLTAKATQEDKVMGLSQGADAYLTKPFDKKELLVRIDNLVSQSKKLRKILSNPNQIVREKQATKESSFLEEVDQIIESNMDKDWFDTKYLCREIAMSRTQLHRKLKALTGQSTAKYIKTLRLKKARALLLNTDLPVGDIADQVGFKDFSHFSRSFHQEYQLSPSECRS